MSVRRRGTHRNVAGCEQQAVAAQCDGWDHQAASTTSSTNSESVNTGSTSVSFTQGVGEALVSRRVPSQPLRHMAFVNVSIIISVQIINELGGI